MDLPYTIPNPRAGFRPFKVLAQYGRWRVITDGVKYIVFDAPDDAIRNADFRSGFGTRQMAEDRAFSADNADRRA